MAAKIAAPRGTPLAFEGGCPIDDFPFIVAGEEPSFTFEEGVLQELFVLLLDALEVSSDFQFCLAISNRFGRVKAGSSGRVDAAVKLAAKAALWEGLFLID
jgi:hypothetical protein